MTTARRRRLDDPERLRRQELGDRIIHRYLRGSPFDAQTIHETAARFEAFHGGATFPAMLRAIGISRDRPYGNRKHGQFRIRPPDQPDLPGVWSPHRVLQALIVGYTSMRNDRGRREVLRDVYAYLGVTPVVKLEGFFHRGRLALVPPGWGRLLELWDLAPVVPVTGLLEQTERRQATEAPPDLPAEIPEDQTDGEEPVEFHRTPRWMRRVAGAIVVCFCAGLAAGFALLIAEVGMGAVATISPPLAAHRSVSADSVRTSPTTPEPSAAARAPTTATVPFCAAVLDERPSACRLGNRETISALARRLHGKSKAWQYAMRIARASRVRVPEWNISRGTVDARRLPSGFILKLPAD